MSTSSSYISIVIFTTRITLIFHTYLLSNLIIVTDQSLSTAQVLYLHYRSTQIAIPYVFNKQSLTLLQPSKTKYFTKNATSYNFSSSKIQRLILSRDHFIKYHSSKDRFGVNPTKINKSKE